MDKSDKIPVAVYNRLVEKVRNQSAAFAVKHQNVQEVVILVRTELAKKTNENAQLNIELATVQG